jgi:hypothetical protein
VDRKFQDLFNLESPHTKVLQGVSKLTTVTPLDRATVPLHDVGGSKGQNEGRAISEPCLEFKLFIRILFNRFDNFLWNHNLPVGIHGGNDPIPTDKVDPVQVPSIECPIRLVLPEQIRLPIPVEIPSADYLPVGIEGINDPIPVGQLGPIHVPDIGNRGQIFYIDILIQSVQLLLLILSPAFFNGIPFLL